MLDGKVNRMLKLTPASIGQPCTNYIWTSAAAMSKVIKCWKMTFQHMATSCAIIGCQMCHQQNGRMLNIFNPCQTEKEREISFTLSIPIKEALNGRCISSERHEGRFWLETQGFRAPTGNKALIQAAVQLSSHTSRTAARNSPVQNFVVQLLCGISQSQKGMMGAKGRSSQNIVRCQRKCSH